MGIDILGIDILGGDILGIDIPAPTHGTDTNLRNHYNYKLLLLQFTVDYSKYINSRYYSKSPSCYVLM